MAGLDILGVSDVGRSLEMYVIYKNPSDYPNKYVARLFLNLKPTKICIVSDCFEELMRQIPYGMRWLNRFPDDDPVIMGVLI